MTVSFFDFCRMFNSSFKIHATAAGDLFYIHLTMRIRVIYHVTAVLACLLQLSLGFNPSIETRAMRSHRTLLFAKPPSDKEPSKKGLKEDIDPLTKVSWYAVEAFGKVFGSKEEVASKAKNFSTDAPPQSIAETLARIQVDNEREYVSESCSNDPTNVGRQINYRPQPTYSLLMNFAVLVRPS